MKPRRSSYKLTFFDKHGPAGEHLLKAYSYGAMVTGLIFSATMLVGAIGGLNIFTPKTLGLVALAAIVAGFVVAQIALNIGDAAGATAKYFTAGGSSTPYEEAFSHEQALIMQRDYAGAAACFEHRIKLAGELPDVRAVIAGADVYRDYSLDPKRSAELYRMAQKLPTLTPGQDVYVANKLADLYLGPLKQPGKALVEFRRLIERYPNSRTADQARMALANVKQDVLAGERG
jgi:hypothetical protein